MPMWFINCCHFPTVPLNMAYANQSYSEKKPSFYLDHCFMIQQWQPDTFSSSEVNFFFNQSATLRANTSSWAKCFFNDTTVNRWEELFLLFLCFALSAIDSLVLTLLVFFPLFNKSCATFNANKEKNVTIQMTVKPTVTSIEHIYGKKVTKTTTTTTSTTMTTVQYITLCECDYSCHIWNLLGWIELRNAMLCVTL